MAGSGLENSWSTSEYEAAREAYEASMGGEKSGNGVSIEKVLDGVGKGLGFVDDLLGFLNRNRGNTSAQQAQATYLINQAENQRKLMTFASIGLVSIIIFLLIRRQEKSS